MRFVKRVLGRVKPNFWSDLFIAFIVIGLFMGAHVLVGILAALLGA